MGDMQHRLFTDAGHGEGGALDALASRDADIARVITAYGPPPDRSLPASFDTLARAVIGQQVWMMIVAVTATKMKLASSHHGKAVEWSLEKS